MKIRTSVLLTVCAVQVGCASVPTSKNISYTKIQATQTDTISISQNVEKIPVAIDGKTYNLEIKTYTPNDEIEKHPLFIFTHGRSGPNPPPSPNAVFDNSALLKKVASRGFVAVMVARRNYGYSDGPDSEYLPSPEASGIAGAKDIQAVAECLRKRSNVDSDRVVIGGHSQGGWIALAGSTLNIPGMIAAVNFSGATNFSNAQGNINSPGVEVPLKQAAERFGSSSKVPVLWMYSEKDNHSVSTVKDWFSSFEAAGGKGELLLIPDSSSIGVSGHHVVSNPDFYFTEMMGFIENVIHP